MSKNICAVLHAGGLLGEHVTTMLLEKGYTVRAGINKPLDNDSIPYLQELKKKYDDKLTLCEYGDPTEPGAFDKLMEGATHVFLLSAPLDHDKSNPQRMVDKALSALRNTFQSIVKAKTVKRIIFTSTAATIASTELFMQPDKVREQLTEKHYNKEVKLEKNPEEFARVRLEEEVTSLANKHNIQIVILNPSLYIGPLCSKKLHGASIDLITNLLHGKQVDVAYPLVDVRDVAQAHIAAMENEKAQGRYILSESYVTFPNELAKFMKKEFPNLPIDLNQKLSAPSGARSDIFDTTRATKELGITFRHTSESVAAMAKSLERFDVVQLSQA